MQGKTITIRNLGPEDAHILDRVADGVFDAFVDPSRVYGFLATRVNDLVVALDLGQVVGFAAGTVLMHPDQPTAFLIQSIRVAASHADLGIEARLLQRLTELAQDRGSEHLWVAANVGDTGTQGLFEGSEWTQCDDVAVYRRPAF